MNESFIFFDCKMKKCYFCRSDKKKKKKKYTDEKYMKKYIVTLMKYFFTWCTFSCRRKIRLSLKMSNFIMAIF